MSYDYEQWKARVASRADITGMLTHLTKPAPDVETKGMDDSKIAVSATANLIKILKEARIKGSTTDKGFIIGKRPAVCFQELPHSGLIQNVEHESLRRKQNPDERIRYCGVGLCFSKAYIYRKGGRPVIYDKTSMLKRVLPSTDHWRIVNFDLSNDKNIIDWTHEREWRLPDDLTFMLNTPSRPHIVLYDKACWDYFVEHSTKEVLEGIHAVTVLKSILM
ncbi:hypothetical protein SAMN05444166_3945 [Singulisphaera sp. GP187]|uniref:hypothetical protein n=1 Tax=Singulisphaera sp. GP187 TaxID=1882752 RepID=UPI0009270175|nr:hypothetical protein [Singulisphaera sp. GP187]SIO34381.1 hypothetical protein SAMN05444166_3945 [Singulisphaera sp. GP187]